MIITGLFIILRISDVFVQKVEMAKSEFSETQFVFAYLRELFQRYSSTLWSLKAPPDSHFLSTVKEKDISADFLIKHYSHSEYYQFKRSDRLKYKLGALEKSAGVAPDFRTYYRFHIYNRRSTMPDGTEKAGQFEKLRDLASNPGDRVYYCAPCFHTEEEFFDSFNKSTIINRSIRIDCSQFNESRFQLPLF